jgi:hypothetical protein
MSKNERKIILPIYSWCFFWCFSALVADFYATKTRIHQITPNLPSPNLQYYIFRQFLSIFRNVSVEG